ncbi:hypothetical protein PUMCH_000714 [Australozyma saopauloensis]|uniref:Telomere replication protein EST3 n=1 Tax=Australozyma saopauloensis TaxID=291208 RepID=A0AAX4H4R7_9ASCO|nr:hypothetical protein PUMCH_000714 [[Candida] saopauloensis]
MSYPVPILVPWIISGLLDFTHAQSAYSNPILKKRFVAYTNGKCLLPWTPLIRILSFVSTTSTGEILVIVHDATHKILARLSRKAILKFEQVYGQRITFETINRLMIFRQADLRFVGDAESPEFGRALSYLGVKYSQGSSLALVFLDVQEIDFFVRDLISVSGAADNLLVLVYRDREYVSRFCLKNATKVADKDDIVSDLDDYEEDSFNQSWLW